jgi:uncharacterized protein YbjT (DUF2867 family)
MAKTAVLLGATGLTGGYLLDLLFEDPSFEKVILLSRSSVNKVHSKLEEHLIDLLNLDNYPELVTGDIVFCCIGTTNAKTKDKAKYRLIDHGIPVCAAKLAKANNVDTFIVISAMGAAADSRIFYNRTKGEMERDVLNQQVKNTYILRPSLIGGDRNESRAGERLAKRFMSTFSFLFPEKYKMIHPGIIARAMIELTREKPSQQVFLSDEIKSLVSHDRN